MNRDGILDIRICFDRGGKNPDENLAYLPTKIMELKDGEPVMAQWNYRIRCAPVTLKEDEGLDLDRLVTFD